MAQSHLTDLAVHKFTKPGVYWDTSLPAFGVRVGKHKKTWVIVPDQRRVQKIIGHYPELPLAKARALARRHLAIRSQYVPLSFEEGYDQFLAYHQANTRPASYDTTKRHLSKLLPKLAKRPLADMQTAEVMHPIDLIKHPSAALHTFVAARQFFRWAASRRYCSNILEGVKAPTKSTRRARVLSDAEIKSIWEACEPNSGVATEETEGVARQENSPEGNLAPITLSGHFATIVKLLILTGQRRGEIAALRAEYCDLNVSAGELGSRTTGLTADPKTVAANTQCTITLPPTLTKNGREHTFPIGQIAQSILTEIARKPRPALLFPARGSTSRAFNGWSKAKAQLDRLSRVKGWTLHDLRRTFRSNLGRLGVAPHIGERLVNHISARTDMEETYDLYTYLPEMRAAIEKWEAHILKITSAPHAAA